MIALYIIIGLILWWLIGATGLYYGDHTFESNSEYRSTIKDYLMFGCFGLLMWGIVLVVYLIKGYEEKTGKEFDLKKMWKDLMNKKPF